MELEDQEQVEGRTLSLELKRLEATNKSGPSEQLLGITSSRTRQLSEAGARSAYQEELERFRAKLNGLFEFDFESNGLPSPIQHVQKK